MEPLAPSREEVERRLHALFLESCSIEVPSAETDLLETGLLDSLTLVELLVQVEHEFAATIPLDALEIDDIRSIRRIAAVVLARRSSAERQE